MEAVGSCDNFYLGNFFPQCVVFHWRWPDLVQTMSPCGSVWNIVIFTILGFRSHLGYIWISCEINNLIPLEFQRTLDIALTTSGTVTIECNSEGQKWLFPCRVFTCLFSLFLILCTSSRVLNFNIICFVWVWNIMGKKSLGLLAIELLWGKVDKMNLHN